MSNTNSSTSNFAIVAAGGPSTKVNLSPLKDNKPVVAFSLLALERNSKVDGIMLVCDKDKTQEYERIVNEYSISKIMAVTSGGPTRYISMNKGLTNLPDCGVVLFHNANNPFITDTEITAVINAAKEFGAAGVGRLEMNTIKVVDDDGFVICTVPRSEPVLRSESEVKPGREPRTENFSMQTPQAIRYELALRAYKHVADNYLPVTDDLQAVEILRISDNLAKIKTISASPFNFRIVTDVDMIAAKSFVAEYEQQCLMKQ